MDRTPLPPPLTLPHRSALPVLLSVPHSGRDYPDWLITAAVHGRAALQALADPIVDRLAGRTIAAGHGAIIAQAARAAIDCNRAPDDIDLSSVDPAFPSRPTRRARAGLGVVPERSAQHGALWKTPLSTADLRGRIDEAHAPYHQAIEQTLDALAIANGQALLLDCHSMPARQGQAELVIGDRHGRAAASWLTRDAARIARAAGWVVAINQPYAGGFIVERHGKPEAGRHALQLEFCRATYLDGDARPSAGFDRASQLLATLAQAMGQALLRPAILAAE